MNTTRMNKSAMNAGWTKMLRACVSLLGALALSLLLWGCASTETRSGFSSNDLMAYSGNNGAGQRRQAIIEPWQEPTAIRSSFAHWDPQNPNRFMQSLPTLSEVRYFDHHAPSSHQSAWDIIAEGLHFEVPLDDPDVKRALRLYTQNQSYFDRVSKNGAPYMHFLIETAKRNQIPMEIVLLASIESDFDPYALSYAGALGMWQFMPRTADGYGIPTSFWYEGRRDVVYSTLFAYGYLTRLYNRFDDWLLAMAAYNGGGGRVSSAITRNKKHGRNTDFWSLSLPSQTEMYVPKILALAEIIKNPRKYGVRLPYVPYKPSFAIVRYKHQISFAQLSEATGAPLKDILMLNSGFSHLHTNPSNNELVLIPYAYYEKAQAFFLQEEASYRSKRTVDVYLATKDETLSEIAARTNMEIEHLLELNDPDHLIAPKHRLLMVSVARNQTTTLKRLFERRKEQYGDEIFYSPQEVYTVKSGDSLWTIARNNGTSVQNLQNWNYKKNGTIRPGERLYVSKPQSVSAMPKTNASDDLHAFRLVPYRIKKNESWVEIARRLRVDPVDLKLWNQDIKLGREQHVRLQINTKSVARQ